MSVPPIVAMEIGTGTVRAVVGEVSDDDHLMITGFGEVDSAGVRKGEVIDFDPALDCVRKALQRAEESSNVLIHTVHVVVTGGHITSIVNSGEAPVLNPRHEITEDEIEHVRTIARAVTLSPDRQVLHTITQRFRVDDQEGVVDPEGLEGSKIAVDMLIVHGVLSRLRNVVKVIRSADVDVADVAFAGLCSALAVLSPEEKEAGAVVLDIGAGTTDYAVYAENAISMAGALPLGGDHITNDLACGLHLPLMEAERLKCTQGSALADMALRSRKVVLVSQPGRRDQTVRLSDVHTIIQARAEEMLELVKRRVEEAKLLHHLGAGVVLTGGGAHLADLVKLAERVWRLPCRIGTPRGVGGLTAVTEKPQFAATVGMIRYAHRAAVQNESGLGWFVKRLWRR